MEHHANVIVRGAVIEWSDFSKERRWKIMNLPKLTTNS